ncbi:MAG: DMT family transporter [Rubrivivax sp.]
MSPARAAPPGPWGAAALLVGSCALFAGVGAIVKALSGPHSAGEMVFYRSLVGMLAMAAWARLRGLSLRTTVPGLHARRCLAGVTALMCWFWSMGGLPLATAMTLNATSSLWLALHFCVLGWIVRRRGGRSEPGGVRVDAALLVAVAAGFAGVAAVLQPTIRADQWLHGLVGLASGALAALAYVQIIDIARAGEPEERVVFYFSIFGIVMGGAMALGSGGFRMPGAMQAFGLLMIGVLATVAQWMMTRAFAHGRPLVNATLQYSGIAFSFLLGVGWFGDPVTPLAVAGMILIVAAGVAATARRAPAHDGTAPARPDFPRRSPP